MTSTVAAPDGSFSASVPIGFGSNAITVGASTGGLQSTGYAQVTVSNEGGGTTVLDVSDPAGDDNGPGTYQYPTDSAFQPGAFDLTRFQVLSDGTTAYLRATIANLAPTFGAMDGAQLLDVYVHVPGAATTSTAAAFPTRNYTIASSGAWSQHAGGAGLRGAGVAGRLGEHGRHAGRARHAVGRDHHDRRCPRRSSAPRARGGASPWC